ncbi:hypothetical protein Cni_G17585 [Canna indica]|uniref:Uncharacterized protein n=1 Tax=Canna indica TaxID=4628 RepID=A0AAQ3KHR8_9LILI|nr:hypothetical protein Cni_G17585 [Canna indica]
MYDLMAHFEALDITCITIIILHKQERIKKKDSYLINYPPLFVSLLLFPFLFSILSSNSSPGQKPTPNMGNAIGARKKPAKIMKVDGTTFKVQPPAQAIKVLRDHPRHDLLESEEVKRLGLRARRLDPDAPLKPGKLYFLVELPRRNWSGKLQVGAKERLESLRLTRRSMSDLSLATRCAAAGDVEETKDGGVRVRVRLPKLQVEKLMQESRDAAEAAKKIMQLCAEKDAAASRALQRTISAVKTDRPKEVHHRP